MANDKCDPYVNSDYGQNFQGAAQGALRRENTSREVLLCAAGKMDRRAASLRALAALIPEQGLTAEVEVSLRRLLAELDR